MPATGLPLKDIHLPATIGWWPPAVGWWILAALILGLLALSIWTYKRLTRKTTLKTAKKLLHTLKHDQAQDNFQKLGEVSILMRRVAMSLYPRAETASLTGHEWLIFLDRSVKGAPFSEGIGRYLADAHFKQYPPTDLDITGIFQLCESWLNANTQKSANKKQTQ